MSLLCIGAMSKEYNKFYSRLWEWWHGYMQNDHLNFKIDKCSPTKSIKEFFKHSLSNILKWYCLWIYIGYLQTIIVKLYDVFS